jgi:exodeoxyribonuclease VII small subunit
MEEMAFESAMSELEEIVRRLDDAELTLEETIALFERGQSLARYCQEKLDKAELRITRITDTAQGQG